jgi:hypothetical protein
MSTAKLTAPPSPLIGAPLLLALLALDEPPLLDPFPLDEPPAPLLPTPDEPPDDPAPPRSGSDVLDDPLPQPATRVITAAAAEHR